MEEMPRKKCAHKAMCTNGCDENTNRYRSMENKTRIAVMIEAMREKGEEAMIEKADEALSCAEICPNWMFRLVERQ